MAKNVRRLAKSISAAEAKKKTELLCSATNLNEIKILYIYGVDAAFAYEVLFSWLATDEERALVFIENDPDEMALLRSAPHAAKMAEDPQVQIYFIETAADLETFCKTAAAYFAEKSYAIVALPERQEASAPFYSQLTTYLSFYLFQQANIWGEYNTFVGPFHLNLFQNILALPSAHIGANLYGLFKNVPAIICGAGPSLEKNGHLLAQLKEHALIITGGSGLNALDAFDLQPHIAVGIDPNRAQLSRLFAANSWMTPFFFRSRINHKALEAMHGEWVFLEGSEGHGLPLWIEEQLGISTHLEPLAEGYNIVNLCSSLAIALGCNPIIYVGVDMAYSSGLSYASGVTAHPFFLNKEFYSTKSSQDDLLTQNDIYGQPIHTVKKWVSEAAWLAFFAKNHPDTKVVNSTEGGIGIEGVENIPLHSAIERYLTQQQDIAAVLHIALQDKAPVVNISKTAIHNLFSELKTNLESCEKMCHKNFEECEEAIKKLGSCENDEQIRALFKSLPLSRWEDSLKEEPFFEPLLREFDAVFLATHRLELERLGKNSFHLPFAVLAYRRLRLQKERHFFLLKKLKVISFALNFDAEKKEEAALRKPNVPEGKKRREGKALVQSQFKEGLREGEQLTYYTNGTLFSRERFVKGKPHGLQEYFFADEVKRAAIPFIEGKIHGTVELFFPDGSLCRSIGFLEGKRHGSEKVFNRRGILIAEALFSQGKAAGKCSRWNDLGELEEEIEIAQEKEDDLRKEENDFFYALVKRSLLYSEALQNISIELQRCAGHLKEEAVLSGKINLLIEEVEKLKKLSKELATSLDFYGNSNQELIWKTPALRKMVENKLVAIQAVLEKEYSALEIAFAMIRKAAPPSKKSEDRNCDE